MNNRTKCAYSKIGYAKYHLKNQPTHAEFVFKKYLDGFGIPYRFQKGVITNKKRKMVRIIDFYIPRINIAFEIDGDYHNTTGQEVNDFKRELEIERKRKNILFVRFTNDEVLQKSDYVRQTIREVYNDRLWDYMNNKRIGQKAREKYKFLYAPVN